MSFRTFLPGTAYNRLKFIPHVPARTPAQPRGPTSVAAESKPILDEELQRLPKKYRAPVVLCDLESYSIVQAAELLACRRSTVRRRLSAGRQLLSRRLEARGLSVSPGSILPAPACSDAPLEVSDRLMTATLRATVAIAQGKTEPDAAWSGGVARLVVQALRKRH